MTTEFLDADQLVQAQIDCLWRLCISNRWQVFAGCVAASVVVPILGHGYAAEQRPQWQTAAHVEKTVEWRCYQPYLRQIFTELGLEVRCRWADRYW